MEHRWGFRYLLDMSVRLERLPNLVALARLRNLSSSGAYIETGAAPAVASRVLLELGCRADPGGGRCRIPAYVVRRDERGIGVEWCEFASRPVLTLIATGWQAHALPPARSSKPAVPMQALR
ncbi:MAG: PilZ domain-containing protein [Steroidobacteraceae bacterium]